MINIVYLYKESSVINSFLERQIKKANLEGCTLSRYTIENVPVSIEILGVNCFHTIIFFDSFGDELLRIIGPFSSEQLEEGISDARKILEERAAGVFI